MNKGIFAYLKVKLKEIQKHYPLINFKTINYNIKQPDNGVNEQIIQKYIENQGQEDSGQALLDLL